MFLERCADPPFEDSFRRLQNALDRATQTVGNSDSTLSAECFLRARILMRKESSRIDSELLTILTQEADAVVALADRTGPGEERAADEQEKLTKMRLDFALEVFDVLERSGK